MPGEVHCLNSGATHLGNNTIYISQRQAVLLLNPTMLARSLAGRHEGLRGKPLFLNKGKAKSHADFIYAPTSCRYDSGPSLPSRATNNYGSVQ